MLSGGTGMGVWVAGLAAGVPRGMGVWVAVAGAEEPAPFGRFTVTVWRRRLNPVTDSPPQAPPEALAAAGAEKSEV